MKPRASLKLYLTSSSFLRYTDTAALMHSKTFDPQRLHEHSELAF